MNDKHEPARRRLSIRGYLVLLVVLVLLPVLAFAGMLFHQYRQTEVARLEDDLLSDARRAALTVDRELAGLQSTLQTLASSRALAAHNFQDFYVQARQVREFIGADILLRDVYGQQLLNTRVPWGTALPFEPLDGDKEAIQSRQPVITGIIVGAVARRPVFTITVPVIHDGRVTHFLNLSLLPERMLELLRGGLGEGRRAGIVDRKGLILARTERMEDLVGKPAAADFMETVREPEGLWRGTNTSGEQVRTAFTRSRLSGWVVYVNTFEAEVRNSLSTALWSLTSLGAAATLSALLMAYLIGGRLSRSMGSLAVQAVSLGRGEPLERKSLPVREIDYVNQTMVAAADTLHEREQERDQAEQGLRALSESLERNVEERTHQLVDEMKRHRQTEETLRQVQKIEAVGQLTGGIAHDFNNMLGIVLGNLDLALRRMAKGETAVERFLVNAQEGGQRAAALTQRLLAFARRQPLAPESLDANRLLAGMSELLRRSLGETVQLETVLAGGLWRAHADHNQLESAILNLAVNARDAMPDGGRLTIETANAHLDDRYAAEHADVPPGQYILIAVSDTGTGMSREVAEKAFDPFFTTKQAGVGTGLGLSQVYGFVKQSGGHVKIYSELGDGTTIKLYLPRFFGTEEEKAAQAAATALPTAESAETILVVEDEAGVRRMAAETLRDLGYTVLEADSGAAALRAIEANPQIALLFTDVVMPDMNGRALAETARKRRPDLKVLFTTGYTRNAIVHNGVLDPDVNLVGKPFTLEQLARKVADVLKK